MFIFQGGRSHKYFVYLKTWQQWKISFFSFEARSGTSLNGRVSLQASGVTDSHGVTGGVYKARERIHRDILIRDY